MFLTSLRLGEGEREEEAAGEGTGGEETVVETSDGESAARHFGRMKRSSSGTRKKRRK